MKKPLKEYKHGDIYPCRTCQNPNTKLDTDTPDGQPLPEGEWTWFNSSEDNKGWEYTECMWK